jgi:hypothetical protein
VNPIVDIVLEEVGYVNGPNLDNKYGKWYGFNNQPYSAMFISWCFGKAGKSELVEVSSKKGFASNKIAYEHFYKKYEQYKFWQVKVGDLVFLDFDGKKKDLQVGVVVGVGRKFGYPLWIETVEADTTADNASAESKGLRTGVYRRTRVKKDLLTIFRLL